MLITPLCLLLIFGLPVVGVTLLNTNVEGGLPATLGLLLLSPLVFTLLYVLTAGACSLVGRPGVIAGQFPRDLGSPIYAMRRHYGLCWTSVYYFKPLYHLCLNLPPLRWLLFRLFGYRGSLGFTLYPDTWIRDLPLLELGPGAYLSNRATLGTNVVLANGDILVGRIRIGTGSLVGHLSMVGLGTNIGQRVEVGIGAAVGIHVVIDDDVTVGPRANIDHAAQIGAEARIGAGAYVAVGAVIEAGGSVAPIQQPGNDAPIVSST